MSGTLAAYSDWLNKEIRGAGVFIGIATLFVTLRITSRFVNRQSGWGYDDLFVLISWLTFTALCVCVIVTENSFLTQLNPHLTRAQTYIPAVTYFKAQYAVTLLYPLATLFPRLATAALYLRIFPTTKRPERIATYAISAFLVVNFIAWFISGALICSPPSDYWNLLKPDNEKHCISQGRKDWVSFPNVISDLILLTIPLRTIYKLHASVAKRVGLLVTFGTGALGLAASCVRFGLYIAASRTAPSALTVKQVAIADIATYVEPGAYLVAVCLPPLRGLFAMLDFKGTFPSLASSRLFRSSGSEDSAKDARLKDISYPTLLSEKSVNDPADKPFVQRSYEARAEAVDMV